MFVKIIIAIQPAVGCSAYKLIYDVWAAHR